MLDKLSKFSKISQLTTAQALTILLLATALLRFYRLDFPSKFMFDEVYHAFTATQYLEWSKEAWRWDSTPPEGVAFEWTHPPLAKEIMALSMYITNSTDAWAWRLPGSLLGVISVFLTFKIGATLFKDERVALISATIFSVDGLNFVQSRIGMNDIYLVTFSLAALLFFLQKRFIFAAMFAGLALSSKWAAIYLLGLLFILLIKNKHFGKVIFFVILVPAVYLLTYVPFFLLGHNFEEFVHLQQQMWWYHTGLTATHPYSSPWWSWPLNLYPVWYFVESQGERISVIYASGNSVLFWTSLAAIILSVWEVIKKRSEGLLIVLLGFLIFWIPWAFSPRIMFLYHFAPSVPFMSLALGYWLTRALGDKDSKKVAVLVLILILIFFIFLFPFLTGLFLDKDFLDLFFYLNVSKNPF